MKKRSKKYRKNAALVDPKKRYDVASAVGILSALAFGFVIGQFGIARPIGTSVANLQALAKEDFTVEISGQDRRDEVGDIARAALVFKQNGIEKKRLQEAQQAAEQQAVAERKREMHRLADGFESAVGDIVETVSSASKDLEGAATTLFRTAETTQQLSTRVAAASGQASSNVQSVASATNEMTASVQEISRQVQESSRIAGEAVRQAEKTDGRIGALSQAAQRIGDVVALITAIAGQTNLLALNATIEAARAGDAGKGFAVVASEVKNLAAQTAKATEEIAAQIGGIQGTTEQAVAALRNITGTIERMNEVTAAIAAAVEEQGAATREIARSAALVAEGTGTMNRRIGDVRAAAEGTGGAAAGTAIALRIQMTALPQLVAAFHSLVGLAAVFVAAAAFYLPEAYGIGVAGKIKTASLVEMGLGTAIGAITFTGSLVSVARMSFFPRERPLSASASAAVTTGRGCRFTYTLRRRRLSIDSMRRLIPHSLSSSLSPTSGTRPNIEYT